MNDPFFLRQEAHVQAKQNPILSARMQKAFRLLEIPTTDLLSFLEVEITHNPLFEFIESPLSQGEGELEEDMLTNEEGLDFSKEDYALLTHLDPDYDDFFAQKELEPDPLLPHPSLDERVPERETLYEHYLQRAFEEFGDDEEAIVAAEILLGYVDERGILGNTVQQIAKENALPASLLEAILPRIQELDPPGIGARNIRESLLLQLRAKRKEKSLAYRIIDEAYDWLCKNQIPQIEEILSAPLEEILDAIEEDIAPLDIHPGFAFSYPSTPALVPDLIVDQDEQERWHVSIPKEGKPILRLRKEYSGLISHPDCKRYMRKQVSDAQWLFSILHQRRRLLQRIGDYIVRHQYAYLSDPLGEMAPLTQREMAHDLGLHESTITRAVANKTVQTPRGVFSLQHFFSTRYITPEGEEVSAHTIQEALQSLIREEDPQHPFSDKELAEKLEECGLPCSRRTIAKYRAQLRIGNAHQRKKFR